MKLHTRARGIPSHPSSPFIIMVRHAYFIMSYKFKCKVEYLHEGTDISTVPLTTCMPHPLILKDRSKLLRTWGKADVPSQWLLASIFQWSAHLQFCMHTQALCTERATHKGTVSTSQIRSNSTLQQESGITEKTILDRSRATQQQSVEKASTVRSPIPENLRAFRWNHLRCAVSPWYY